MAYELDVNQREPDLIEVQDELEADYALLGYVLMRLEKVNDLMHPSEQRGDAGIELAHFHSWVYGRQQALHAELARTRVPED